MVYFALFGAKYIPDKGQTLIVLKLSILNFYENRVIEVLTELKN